MLNAREPKVVNGPEILNKYVGASEENIRKLFADAEKEVSLHPNECLQETNIVFSTRRREMKVVCTLSSLTSWMPSSSNVGVPIVEPVLEILSLTSCFPR